MTQKDLYNQRLLKEANERSLQFTTRRHFLKESAMGLGALAMGSLIGLIITVLVIVAFFKMRSSLVQYYNTATKAKKGPYQTREERP